MSCFRNSAEGGHFLVGESHTEEIEATFGVWGGEESFGAFACDDSVVADGVLVWHGVILAGGGWGAQACRLPRLMVGDGCNARLVLEVAMVPVSGYGDVTAPAPLG